MPDDRTYTSSDLAVANISKDISYIKEEIKNINVNISSGYTPLSDHNALKDKVALIYRALAFLLGLIALAIAGAISKLILR